MSDALTPDALQQENLRYGGTNGVSENASSYGFLPAFQDTDTGETHLATYADGRVSPVHLLDGLPAQWIIKRDARGRVLRIKDSIVSGFLCNGRFYTREELANRDLDS